MEHPDVLTQENLLAMAAARLLSRQLQPAGNYKICAIRIDIREMSA